MELHEAIQHLDESIRGMSNCSCRDEHIQLWRWLKELEQYRSHLFQMNGLRDAINRVTAPGEVPNF